VDCARGNGTRRGTVVKRKRNLQTNNKWWHEKMRGKCGERGEEEDDSGDKESDEEGVVGQGSGVRAQSQRAPGRIGGVILDSGKDAALGSGKDAASDGE
jgi:hypothetical protein